MLTTEVDATVLDGLAVLTDRELSRVQAHLAAGLPMTRGWGYRDGEWQDDPAICGCLVGVAMNKREAFLGPRHEELWNRTSHAFIFLVHDTDREFWREPMDQPISDAARVRLARLLDIEWQRRHPVHTEVDGVLVGANS